MRKPKLPACPDATISEAGGVRYLHLGTPWVQGAMRIRRPQEIELDYVRRMMVWTLLWPADTLCTGAVVQLGMGSAAIGRFTFGRMQMATTVVELNPAVIHVNRLCFHLPADGAGFRTVQADAGAWVADAAHAGSASVVCVDLYDDDAAGPVLDSERFYADCHRVLASPGVMTVNLFGRNASFAASVANVAASFGADGLFSLQPTREGNTVLVATKGCTLPSPELRGERAAAVEEAFGLPARKWLKMIRTPIA